MWQLTAYMSVVLSPLIKNAEADGYWWVAIIVFGLAVLFVPLWYAQLSVPLLCPDPISQYFLCFVFREHLTPDSLKETLPLEEGGAEKVAHGSEPAPAAAPAATASSPNSVVPIVPAAGSNSTADQKSVELMQQPVRFVFVN